MLCLPAFAPLPYLNFEDGEGRTKTLLHKRAHQMARKPAGGSGEQLPCQPKNPAAASLLPAANNGLYWVHPNDGRRESTAVCRVYGQAVKQAPPPLGTRWRRGYYCFNITRAKTDSRFEGLPAIVMREQTFSTPFQGAASARQPASERMGFIARLLTSSLVPRLKPVKIEPRRRRLLFLFYFITFAPVAGFAQRPQIIRYRFAAL